MRKSVWLIILGLLYLITLEIMKVYWIMPFPGSQKSDSVSFAYFLHRNAWWLRIAGVVLITGPLLSSLAKGKIWQKTLLVLVILLYLFIYYLFNFRFLADKIFYEPTENAFVPAAADTTNKDRLIIGVVINNEAKAYPIELIGYHHQVIDSMQQKPIMVTYCTVCRSGRVFSPYVNGKYEKFRLVGMDHFNAMFEDATTKSWWRQATGVAITGKLKGHQLTEIPSTQMRLGEWLSMYPSSEIFQPDSNFKKQYAGLKGFDDGTIKGKLEHRDSLSWHNKSWIVGVAGKTKSRAYDWNELVKQKMIADSLDELPLLLTVEPHGKTFYALNRNLDGKTLQFVPGLTQGELEDMQTHSTWKLNGTCTRGPLQGKQLQRIQAYQEFWHSWKSFHPNTTAYQIN
ncbi:MAG: DUF3179 domain-containing (seleno)protein [Bacteroidota bacterium]